MSPLLTGCQWSVSNRNRSNSMGKTQPTVYSSEGDNECSVTRYRERLYLPLFALPRSFRGEGVLGNDIDVKMCPDQIKKIDLLIM